MVNIGDPAPDFTAQDVMSGQTFKLSNHFGKVIFIAFVGYT